MPVFFVDRSLGRHQIPDILREAGLDIRVHDEIFAQDAEDPDWISKVTGKGWVILTKDKNIRYRPLEIRAVRASGARMFVLASGNLNGQEMAEAFLTAKKRIERFAVRHRNPFIAKVYKDGTVRAWWP